MGVITKKLFREWLTGYLTGSIPTKKEDLDNWFKSGELAQKRAGEIIQFLEYYDYFSKDIKDE